MIVLGVLGWLRLGVCLGVGVFEIEVGIGCFFVKVLGLGLL